MCVKKRSNNRNIYGKFNGESYIKISNKGRYPSQLFLSKECSEILDEQSGNLKSGDNNIRKTNDRGMYETAKAGQIEISYGDSGGCSRINHNIQYELEEILLMTNFEKWKELVL